MSTFSYSMVKINEIFCDWQMNILSNLPNQLIAQVPFKPGFVLGSFITAKVTRFLLMINFLSPHAWDFATFAFAMHNKKYH